MTGEPETEGFDGGNEADARMADLLARGEQRALARAKKEMLKEGTETSQDVIGRMNALEFVDSLVGETMDIPEILGDYRITGLLGRGGMGTVYEAWHVTLEREVAIKVLSPVYSANPTMRQRFRSEARLTASLHHQHIVPIYDYGEVAGFLFFAMEKVDGISLDKHISSARRQQKTAMEPREAGRRFAGVADALGHAHKRRLLHRDVKPGNILVSGDGTMALADFGLSKVLGDHSARLTTQGGFLGTLHYASPEQALGQPLSAASDLYSLGVTMFESVAGQLPRDSENTESLLNAIVYGRALCLREVMPQASRDLDLVLEKLMTREVSERYQDGEALARDLMRVGDGEPIQIRRQPLWVRLWRRARRNPGLTAASIAAVVLLLVVGFLANGIARARRESQGNRYELRLNEAVDQARLDAGAPGGSHGLVAVLTGIDPPGPTAAPRVLATLERAISERPEDPRPKQLLAAYRDDPLPGATDLLRQGQAFAAIQLLDERIVNLSTERGSGDRAAELSLYQLYLARAVGRLSASVADPQGAHTDLEIASFLRAGTFLPKALDLCASLTAGETVPEILGRVSALAASATPEGRAVLGQLLSSSSGLQRAAGCNLMRVHLPFRQRLLLLGESLRLWPERPDTLLEAQQPTGIEAALAQHGREAFDNPDSLVARVPYIDAGRQLLRDGISDKSPLQCWNLVYRVLENPAGNSEFRTVNGTLLPPASQLEGWLRFFSFDPEPQFDALVRDRIIAFVDAHPELPGTARLLSALFRRLGGPSNLTSALHHADRWVARDPEDPSALFERFALHLRALDLDLALDDATSVVSLGPDRGRAIERVCTALEQALSGQPPGDRAANGIREMLEAFRAVGN